MNKWFERHVAFSRRELTGICVLGVFLLALWLAPRLYRTREVRDSDLSDHIVHIERFLATANATKPLATEPVRKPASAPRRGEPIEYVAFDPNGLAVTDWKRLGLSEGQIRVIKNYEAKGGRFRKKEDLKKIYSIDEADYSRLEPYIRISTTGESSVPPRPDSSYRRSNDFGREEPARQLIPLDLNATDSLELQRLPGIGPVYASRIVRFRDRLGGFYHISQLMDVYGFDTARFDGLKAHIFVDTASVKKIALNVADYDRLRNHPLISPKLANAIVQYRKQHGPYRSLADLLNIAIMDEGIFRKIAPYLTIVHD
ncbi:ComEA family DNA-binding protein [Parapedobacter sp. DT-150]|uniref:ComEA family DNA-binding protein n=1 Tax=Parapedobacter sp. DT-150 TaxID=3396162 RepID=UPI003F1D189A